MILAHAHPGAAPRPPPSWIVSEGEYPVEFLASLQRLLDLPIELVLVSHGEPVLENAREALERALAS
jgi:glyoxylase-like metal-dependent hydrolase (beta-lactamase superfamily II)